MQTFAETLACLAVVYLINPKAAITFGMVYYIRSRRDLETAMHEVQMHPTIGTMSEDEKHDINRSHDHSYSDTEHKHDEHK